MHVHAMYHCVNRGRILPRGFQLDLISLLRGLARSSAEVVLSHRRWLCVPVPVLCLFVRCWACVISCRLGAGGLLAWLQFTPGGSFVQALCGSVCAFSMLGPVLRCFSSSDSLCHLIRAILACLKRGASFVDPSIGGHGEAFHSDTSSGEQVQCRN
jgi:hypothetical protein